MILTWIPSIRSSSDGGAAEFDPTERDVFFLAASEDEDSVEFGTFSRLSLKVLFKSKSVKNESEWKAFWENQVWNFLKMKICEILLFGIMIGTEGRKTPFERRLLKTFNILNTWGNQHLDGHEHFLVKLADKDNKVGHAKNFPSLFVTRLSQIATDVKRNLWYFIFGVTTYISDQIQI